MTIGGMILLAFITIVALGCAICVSNGYRSTSAKAICYIVAVAAIVITFAIQMWYYHSTESGKRAMKSQESNLNAGIERSVSVYDVDGDLIKKYEGRFDVDYDSNRIIFDDEHGKRHIIYYPTGTVIIDEI